MKKILALVFLLSFLTGCTIALSPALYGPPYYTGPAYVYPSYYYSYPTYYYRAPVVMSVPVVVPYRRYHHHHHHHHRQERRRYYEKINNYCFDRDSVYATRVQARRSLPSGRNPGISHRCRGVSSAPFLLCPSLCPSFPVLQRSSRTLGNALGSIPLCICAGVDSPALREDSLSVRKGILTTPRLNPTKPGFIIEKPSGKKYNQRMKQRQNL